MQVQLDLVKRREPEAHTVTVCWFLPYMERRDSDAGMLVINVVVMVEDRLNDHETLVNFSHLAYPFCIFRTVA